MVFLVVGLVLATIIYLWTRAVHHRRMPRLEDDENDVMPPLEDDKDDEGDDELEKKNEFIHLEEEEMRS